MLRRDHEKRGTPIAVHVHVNGRYKFGNVFNKSIAEK